MQLLLPATHVLMGAISNVLTLHAPCCTGSGASSRALGGEGPSRHRRGRSSSSNALLNFSKKGPLDDESLAGKAGLLTADAPSEDDYDCCPTCLEAYTDGEL